MAARYAEEQLHKWNTRAEEGEFKVGDRIGFLLNMDEGTLLFFKNGKKHGPGHRGIKKGAVVRSVEMYEEGDAVAFCDSPFDPKQAL